MTDEIFEALANGYRRRLLLGLLHRNRMDVSRSAGIGDVISDDRETRIANHHIHHPKLEGYGFIDWDSERQVVTRGPRFDEIRPVLEFLDENREGLLPGRY